MHAPAQKYVKLDYHLDELILTITHPLLAEPVQIWCMEAYCKKGSTHRNWEETTIAQKNTLLEKKEYEIIIKSVVDDCVEVTHRFAVVSDEILFESTFSNISNTKYDLEWMQPCIRVGNFTNLSQEEYIRKCFIFTEKGLTRLCDTKRTEEAIYRGGQVYIPSGINPRDVNPRPISPDVPVKNLIGCFSNDESVLMATAWNHVQELFQGVISCIHADPGIGGLLPQETKQRWGKLYIIPNDIEELLCRYKRDFE